MEKLFDFLLRAPNWVIYLIGIGLTVSFWIGLYYLAVFIFNL